MGWNEADGQIVYSGELARLHNDALGWFVDDFRGVVEVTGNAEYFYMLGLAGVIVQGIEGLVSSDRPRARKRIVAEIEAICPRRIPENVGAALDVLDLVADYFGGDLLARCPLIRRRAEASLLWEIGPKSREAMKLVDRSLGPRFHVVVSGTELTVEELHIRFDPPLPPVSRRSGR